MIFKAVATWRYCGVGTCFPPYKSNQSQAVRVPKCFGWSFYVSCDLVTPQMPELFRSSPGALQPTMGDVFLFFWGWYFFVLQSKPVFLVICCILEPKSLNLRHFRAKINSKFAWYLEHFSFRQFSHGHVWMVFIDFLMDSNDFSMVSEIRSCFLSSPLNRITTRTDMQWCRFSVVLKVYAMHNIHLLNL